MNLYRRIIFKLCREGVFNWLSDAYFLRLKYRVAFGKSLNLKEPKSFNEKQNWLKLYDRKEIYTLLVDKIAVKPYVAKIIGEDIIIPTLGVWDNPEDINFDNLPDKFVIKCNHNSGLGMYICKDKSKLDVNAIKEKLKKGLKQNYYLSNREWPYKNVPRKILVEQYMEDDTYHYLRDYKFFCFDGKVKALFIATDRDKGEHHVKFDFFDEEFNHLPFTNGHPNATVLPEKPSCFEKMKKIASTLSKGLPSVRVDLYEINGKVYFGEITFTHWGGFVPFVPEEWDYKFGNWIELPIKE